MGNSKPLNGFRLRLMSSLDDVSGIPEKRKKNLIIVAAVNCVLHFRIFGDDGEQVVDTDEKRLTKQARQIEDLKRQLERLWPPHKLTRREESRIVAEVTSVVGYIPLNWPNDWEWALAAAEPRVINVCNRYHLSFQDTQDVILFVTLQICRIKDSNHFETLESFKTWARKVARNFVLKTVLKNKFLPSRWWGFDLLLIYSESDISSIPTSGKKLVIVANVEDMLHFRIFDAKGKVVVDTDETRLAQPARLFADLKRQLDSLKPPHELTPHEKSQIVAEVTSIVDHFRPRIEYCDPAILPAQFQESASSSNPLECIEMIRDVLEREALRLRVIEERSYEEIAARLGVSTGKAYKLVQCAIETLRLRLGPA